VHHKAHLATDARLPDPPPGGSLEGHRPLYILDSTHTHTSPLLSCFLAPLLLRLVFFPFFGASVFLVCVLFSRPLGARRLPSPCRQVGMRTAACCELRTCPGGTPAARRWHAVCPAGCIFLHRLRGFVLTIPDPLPWVAATAVFSV